VHEVVSLPPGEVHLAIEPACAAVLLGSPDPLVLQAEISADELAEIVQVVGV
jgi:hypothetical protein